MQVKNNKGQLPDPGQLFFDTHNKLDKTTGERVLTSKKAMETYVSNL